MNGFSASHVAVLLIVMLELGLAGCLPRRSAGGRVNTPAAAEQRLAPEAGIVMFFRDAAVVEWSDDDASLLLTLRGNDFRRGKLDPPRPGILVLVIDGVSFQIIDLDSRTVTAHYASTDELLSKHRQWETEYWNRSLGVPVEARIEKILNCECGASLWQVKWPEEVRAARQVKAMSQVYLSFVVGHRIVVVSSAVMDGESVADRLAYLGNVARDVHVQQGPINQEELRRWLKENGWEVSPTESDRS